MSTEAVVTPWEVSGKVDYDKLAREFGTLPITQELLDRFIKITGKDLHPWLKRGIFFTHRYFDEVLTAVENGDPVFLYTGRGPTTDSMHLGHLVPFQFTKWLQDAFNCPVVIQISDEEKSAFKNLPFQEIYKLGFENAKDIIAVGFDPKKTFIFSNFDYRCCTPEFESLAFEMSKKVNRNTLDKIFGFDQTANIAMLQWPIYQTAAAFSQAFPHLFNKPARCLIPYAIDQDPYFRLARDIAEKLGLFKPASIICKFIPPLDGGEGKMSSSVVNSSKTTLFLTDTKKDIEQKIKAAKSGARGDGSKEDHERLGGDIDADIACQYLKLFDFNDEEMNALLDEFSKGKKLCGHTKQRLIPIMTKIILDHQQKRAEVTDEVLNYFYSKKK